jgi:sugar O-acyltransferase (sialic acid O-acetyltransferase NeuD family)
MKSLCNQQTVILIMKKVIIFGTGGFAKIIYLYLQKDPTFNIIAFTANEQSIKEKTLYNLPVVPFETIEQKYSPDEYEMFIALGYTDMNRKRAKFFKEAKDKGYTLISYIHPSSIVNDEFQIGENCFIFENNVIQPFVKLEDNVIIWTGNVISHHTTIKNHCFIVSHVAIAGNTVIEPYCFIGINATIRNSIRIAKECIIGAGTVILKDTNEKEVYTSKSTVKLDITSDAIKNL